MKILIALSRFPWPTDKGDKLRAWNHIQGLAEEHDVYLFCTSDEVVTEEQHARVSQVCKDITVFRLSKLRVGLRLLANIWSALPFQIAYFTDRKAVKKFQSLAKEIKPDVIFCQLARMAEYCRGQKDVFKLIDYQDAFSKGLQRRLEHSSPFKRWLIRNEFNRLKQYERSVFSDFNCQTIISAQDAGFIDHPRKEELIVLPNGVDTDYYKPQPAAQTVDLLFTGNMQYQPNVNCVVYLVKQVLPILKNEFPHIQLVAAGKNPSPELSDLKSRNLQLTGWVDDLRCYYRQSRLFVAPMQIGIGMQNKILEAMAMGMPVITSTLANNAIGGIHGKHVWIADTPEKVAEGISFLLNNTELAIRLGRNARKLMVEEFSWQNQNQRLATLITGYTPNEKSFRNN